METRSVLVVDSDPFVRDVVSSSLAGRGYIVTAVSDGSEGFTKACETKFALIVIGSMNPGLSPEQFVRRLLLHNCGAPDQIVFLPSAGSAIERTRAIEQLIDALQRSR